MSGPLIASLRDVVGDGQVLVAPEDRLAAETDWMGRRRGDALAVVRPGRVEEVAAVVEACAAAGAAVVAQGGNTGLVGGGIPRGGEVVLSTARLDWVGEPDGDARQVAAGAGATLATVRAAALPAHLDVGLDLASRERATVGGMVATNAGGLRVLRHGHTRAHLAGVEAVLADGRVIRRMAGLAKDTAGYDLTGLLCGSEGTLAVITAVLLRLVPLRPVRVTALIGVESVAHAVDVVGRLRAELDGLESAEIMFPDGMRLVRDLFGTPLPFAGTSPAYLLVELTAGEGADAGAVLGDAVEVLARWGDVGESAVADHGAGRERLWALRERHPDVVAKLGVPHKLDVAVPLARLADFEMAVRAALAPLGAVVVLYGHVGDGSLHVNVATPAPAGGAVEDAVFGVVADFGGTISAEHGIGTDKLRWLDRTRDTNEIAVMRAIKAALDPEGVLNPGVLLASP
ncbi:MAG: FAD-binding oxidoreductase [Acidimicrobiales bacterium]